MIEYLCPKNKRLTKTKQERKIMWKIHEMSLYVLFFHAQILQHSRISFLFVQPPKRQNEGYYETEYRWKYSQILKTAGYDAGAAC